MLNKQSADGLVAMLREGMPALALTERALREFPSFAPFAGAITGEHLDQAREALGVWIAETIAARPVPAGAGGLWLAVSVAVVPHEPAIYVPVVALEPRPADTDESWERLDHWADAPPWQLEVLTTAIRDPAALEELAMVVLAGLLRDLVASRPASLTGGLGGDFVLEVRPQSAGETITVGVLGPDGFTTATATQSLWCS